MNMQAKNDSPSRDIVSESAADDLNRYPEHKTSTTSLVLDPDAMDKMMRLAEIMAGGVATIPEHLQGNASDCLAVIMQSMQWKMNPYAVAQKTHTVKGVLGYEAQLVNAVITSNAPIKGRLNYEWFGDWSKVTGKFEIKNGSNGEYRIPGWKLADEEGLGVRITGTLRGEDEPRVLEVLLAQARTRNSTLWADDPRLQLAYLGIKKWSRLHTPDVILGVYTPDEINNFDSSEPRDITPKSEGRATEPEELPIYSDEEFKANLSTWKSAIMEGKANAAFIKNKVSSKAQMTDKQFEKLKNIELDAAALAQEAQQ
ncbi:RecT family recombinase [Gilvimarinus chinensis]|uniref:RecT family recombinase n=1 Tax=Gilvimarinus chinensis TaxID=396005 RepID=UPI00037D4615|nr:RecT family recombinase [Gilvimarinus chinensis]